LAREGGKYWKVFGDRYMFDDGRFYVLGILYAYL
jgi:hypothetical protein